MPDQAATAQQVLNLKRDIADQEALLRRTILQGFPSQAAEDRLRALQQRLQELAPTAQPLLEEKARQ